MIERRHPAGAGDIDVHLVGHDGRAAGSGVGGPGSAAAGASAAGCSPAVGVAWPLPAPRATRAARYELAARGAVYLALTVAAAAVGGLLAGARLRGRLVLSSTGSSPTRWARSRSRARRTPWPCSCSSWSPPPCASVVRPAARRRGRRSGPSTSPHPGRAGQPAASASRPRAAPCSTAPADLRDARRRARAARAPTEPGRSWPSAGAGRPPTLDGPPSASPSTTDASWCWSAGRCRRTTSALLGPSPPSCVAALDAAPAGRGGRARPGAWREANQLAHRAARRRVARPAHPAGRRSRRPSPACVSDRRPLSRRRRGASCSRRSRSPPTGSTSSSATCSTCRRSRPAARRPPRRRVPARRGRRASARLAPRPTGDRVRTQLDDDLPLPWADAGLLDRVLANVLENALRHSPGRRERVVQAEPARRPGAGPRRRPGARGPTRPARADLRALPARRRRPAAATGSASGWRSPGASPRPWTARLGRGHPRRRPDHRHRPARGRRDATERRGRRDRRPGRRRRAPHLRRTLAINLRARDYEVELAADGRRPCSAPRDRMPDVVILDLGLPDLDGVEVLRRLRGSRGCRSSCCRPGTTPTTRSRPSTPAPTTTSPSRSGWTSYWPGSGRRSAARRRRPTSELVVTTEHFTLDFGERHAVGADGEEIRLTPTEWRLARAPGPPPRAPRHAYRAAPGGVGSGLRPRAELPAGLRQPAAPQARTRPGSTALPRHRAGRRLPLRRLRVAAGETE